MMISTLWSPWTVHQYSSAVRARLGGGVFALETIYCWKLFIYKETKGDMALEIHF